MSTSRRMDSGLGVSEDKWRAVLTVAEDLAEKVAGLPEQMSRACQGGSDR